MSKKRQITITLNESEIENLESLAEWLEDQKHKPYQHEFNERAEKWQETIETILEGDIN